MSTALIADHVRLRHRVFTLLKHLDTFSLVAYRDSLREASLSMPDSRPNVEESTRAVVKTVQVLDLEANTDGRVMHSVTPGIAIEHHIAANMVLKYDRGYSG